MFLVVYCGLFVWFAFFSGWVFFWVVIWMGFVDFDVGRGWGCGGFVGD